jgi:AAA domain
MNLRTEQFTLDDFLASFFPDEDEAIRLRTIAPSDAPDGFTFPQKIGTTRKLLRTDATLQQLERLNERNGLYFLVNSGGDSDKEITRYNAFFAESDSSSTDEQHCALNDAPIQPSIRVETKKSVHGYWLIKGGCDETEWRDIQARLIAYFAGDPKIKNPSRPMRLPLWNHVAYDKEEGTLSYKHVEIVELLPTHRFTVAEMKEAFPLPETEQEPSRAHPVSYSNGVDPNADLKEWIVRNGRRNNSGIFETRGICHNGRHKTALCYNPKTDAFWCSKGCDTATIRRAAELPVRPQSAISSVYKLAAAETLIVDDGWIAASDIIPEDVAFLWSPYVPLGKLTFFDGEAGIGKSFATSAVAAAVSLGQKLDGAKPITGEAIEPHKVIMVSAEDGLADTIRPRLDLLGAKTDYIFLREKAITFDETGLRQLEAIIDKEKPALVVIDPLFAFVGGIDIYRDNEARSITTPLAEIAQKYNCAIVLVRHPTKAQQKAIHAGGGSVGFIGAARSAVLFGRNPDNPDECVIAHIKHNLSEKGASLGYKIAEDEEGKVLFQWLGGRDITAERLLADAPIVSKVTRRQAVRATITREMSKREIVAANPDVKERTLERYLNEDVRDGFIIHLNTGYYAPQPVTNGSVSAAANSILKVAEAVDEGATEVTNNYVPNSSNSISVTETSGKSAEQGLYGRAVEREDIEQIISDCMTERIEMAA